MFQIVPNISLYTNTPHIVALANGLLRSKFQVTHLSVPQIISRFSWKNTETCPFQTVGNIANLE